MNSIYNKSTTDFFIAESERQIPLRPVLVKFMQDKKFFITIGDIQKNKQEFDFEDYVHVM